MQALNYHNLCVSPASPSWQNEVMENQDKNGGVNYLREWREFRKLTQQELAEAVETNANMIQYLEKGQRGLSAKWLRKLAAALDTTPGMILDHDPNALDSDVIEIWATASNKEQRQIADVMRATLKTGASDK